MAKVLCSTGALIGRPNGRDITLLTKYSLLLDCDGFEFMMYDTWYDRADEITQYLIGTGLCFPVMHCEKHIGGAISLGGDDMQRAFGLFETNCRIARGIGAQKLVLHLWDGITSDSNFPCNLSAYKQLREISDSYGIDLLIENVVCNMGDPMTHWCEIARSYPDAHFVFDTKMAAFHEQDSLIFDKEFEWLWKEGHIKHLHINDYGGGYMQWDKLKTLPLGQGHIDFDKFFAHIKMLGYDDTFTVEATAFDQSGNVDTDMLCRCFDTVRGYTNR